MDLEILGVLNVNALPISKNGGAMATFIPLPLCKRNKFQFSCHVCSFLGKSHFVCITQFTVFHMFVEVSIKGFHKHLAKTLLKLEKANKQANRHALYIIVRISQELTR